MISDYPYYSLDNLLSSNKKQYVVDGSIIDNKESDNAFEGRDDTIINNSDVDINDLGKLKTEVIALKMFITDQLYLLK